MKKIEALTEKAKKVMEHSRDPIHDLNHVSRVAAHTERLCKDLNLSQEQTDALILAAWWHDAARTITKNPSIIWMPFVDDLLSAIMLWYQTVRHGLFGSVAGMATRVIFCKSAGIGGFLSKFLLKKKNRIMVDILKDADTLDLLHQERIHRFMHLADRSWLYKFGYKTTFHWFLSSFSELKMKTQAARKYAVDCLKLFLQWLHQSHVRQWHRQHFGREWTQRILEQGHLLIKKLELLSYQSSKQQTI